MGIARRHARGREKGPLQIYQDVGLEVEILGPARDYWGDRTPAGALRCLGGGGPAAGDLGLLGLTARALP
jgi:hypothetical protein